MIAAPLRGRVERRDLIDLCSRLLDMVEAVEWVRREAGAGYVCPFCHALSERSGGPGHQPDCQWQSATRQGNEYRLVGCLR